MEPAVRPESTIFGLVDALRFIHSRLFSDNDKVIRGECPHRVTHQ